MSDITRFAEEYLPLSIAARMTGRSTSGLRILFDQGRLRGVRDAVGRRLILREDVERLARERLRDVERLADERGRSGEGADNG